MVLYGDSAYPYNMKNEIQAMHRSVGRAKAAVASLKATMSGKWVRCADGKTRWIVRSN